MPRKKKQIEDTRKVFNEYTKHLPVKLEIEEIIEYSKRLSEAITHLNYIEDEKAQAMAEFKARLGKANQNIKELSGIVASGEVERAVEVVERVDFEANKVHLIREDTKAEVEVRVLEAWERQRLLEFDEDEEREQPEKVDPKARSVVEEEGPDAA